MKHNASTISNLATLSEGSAHPLVRMCGALYNAGAREMTVEFSGSGDSGDVDDVYFRGEADAQLVEDVRASAYDVYDPDVMADWLGEVVPIDWVNNDGGGGTATINLETLEVNISCYYYELEAHDGPPVSMRLDQIAGVELEPDDA